MVEVASGRTRKTYHAVREIIVSSGTINSPRLLTLSGIGDAERIGKLEVSATHHLPGVGWNLHDRLDVNVVLQTCNRIGYDGHDRMPYMVFHGACWLLVRTGPASSVMVEGGSFHIGEGADRPDLQIHVAPATVVRGSQPTIEGHGFAVNSTFLRPQSRGEVSLRSADVMEAPVIDPNHLEHVTDRAKALESIRTNRRILSQPSTRNLIAHERLPGPDAQSDEKVMEHVRQYACCDYHPVGTCKMGRDGMAVVDNKLCVHGLDGLRVIGSSIMPVLASGNTNAPSIVVGEKGADFVKEATSF